MSAVQAGGSGGYIPDFASSGRMQIMYTRNPRDFTIARIAQRVPTKKDQGYYLRIDSARAIRVLESGAGFKWPDGADAPRGAHAKHTWLPFHTQRRAYPFEIGQRAVAMADYEVVSANAALMAHLAMTVRTVEAMTVLTTAGNYLSGMTATSTSLAGGVLLNSSAANAYVEKAFRRARDAIRQKTNGMVKGARKIYALMDPYTARLLRETPEVRQYLLNHGKAIEALMDRYPDFDDAGTGLPPELFGCPIEIEDTVVNTANEGATDALSYLLSGGTTTKAKIVFGAYPQSLEGVPGAPSFSSLASFDYEEMTVERFDDQKNRRVEGRVVEDFDYKLVSPASTYLLTNVDAAAD